MKNPAPSDDSSDFRADIPYSYLHHILEADKTQLSRDLHDGLGQELTILKMGIAEVMRTNPKDRQLKAKCRQLMRRVDGIIETVRKFCRDLHPALLEDLGLFPTLEWYFEHFERQTGLQCRWHRAGEEPNVEPEKAIQIFRIVQEAFTNVARHARAKTIEISTSGANGEFIIAIRDDGKGISQSQLRNSRSAGLMNMKERARLIGGRLDISHSDAPGTVVHLRIPLVYCSARFGTVRNQKVVQTLNSALDDQFRLIARSMALHAEIRTLKKNGVR